MAERWELVELIGQTLGERNITASEQTVEAVLDSVEDLIRADERKQIVAEYVPVLMQHMQERLDLYDGVVALEEHIVEHGELWVRRAAVLALFDGGSG